jgi:hypothetical protein
VFRSVQRAGGIPEIRWAEVAHPLGSCTKEQLQERAESALVQFLDIVVAKPH